MPTKNSRKSYYKIILNIYQNIKLKINKNHLGRDTTSQAHDSIISCIAVMWCWWPYESISK